MCHYCVFCVDGWKKNAIDSVLNSGCNTTKCGMNKGVWILSEGTVLCYSGPLANLFGSMTLKDSLLVFSFFLHCQTMI